MFDIENEQKKCSPEMRERALRMLDEAKPEHPNLMAAVRHRRREVDAGERPGVPSDVEAENTRLRREIAELKKANELLKAASIFFAKELDHPSTK